MDEQQLQAILKDMGRDIDRMKQEICVLKARVEKQGKLIADIGTGVLQ